MYGMAKFALSSFMTGQYEKVGRWRDKKQSQTNPNLSQIYAHLHCKSKRTLTSEANFSLLIVKPKPGMSGMVAYPSFIE
jgi:hypothetical protein